MVRSQDSGWRRTFTPLSIAFAAILVLAACAPIDEGDGDGDASAAASNGGGGGGQLSIATGGTGGVYYPLGEGVASVIRDNVSGYDATVQETNASVDNLQLIGNGGADIAFSLGDTAADAVEGRGDFEGAAVEACALGKIYNNFTQLVTSADSGIASIADLEGKRVSLGSPGSGTEVIALRILEAAGIDPDSGIERQQLGVDETAAALRDGTIDAGFWSGGLPTGALVDYATTGEMVLVPTAEVASAMADEYGPFYVEAEIPADTYEGQTEAIPSVVVPNVLVVSTEMDEGLQEQLTAAIFGNQEALAAVHPAANEIDVATADEVEFMDVCPGAQAWFDEQG